MSGIPYQQYVRESLRGVMPRVLRQIAVEGMVGDHSFYLTFSTKAEGVMMPTALRAEYPSSMTIVLQHQFEALEVSDESFSVTLRFGGTPARLTIPYTAVSVFVDPSIDFAIQFDGNPSAITGQPPKSSTKTAGPTSKSTSHPPSEDSGEPGDEGKVVRVDFSKR